MQFFTGELGKAIRGILQRAKEDPSIEIYCALFELDLDDLIQGLIDVGERAHVTPAGSLKAPACVQPSCLWRPQAPLVRHPLNSFLKYWV
jgi:hypothetical protein